MILLEDTIINVVVIEEVTKMDMSKVEATTNNLREVNKDN